MLLGSSCASKQVRSIMAGQVKEAESERQRLEEQLQVLKQRVTMLGEAEREREESKETERLQTCAYRQVAEEAQHAVEESRQREKMLAGEVEAKERELREREGEIEQQARAREQEMQRAGVAMEAKEEELQRVVKQLDDALACGVVVREEAEQARSRAELEAEQARKEIAMLSQELVDQAQNLCSCKSELLLFKKAQTDFQAQISDLQKQIEAEMSLRKDLEASMQQNEHEHLATKEAQEKIELQLVHALEQNERREADVCQLQAAVEISEQHFQQVREDNAAEIERLTTALLAAEKQVKELNHVATERTEALEEAERVRMQLTDREGQVERHKIKVQRLIEHLAQAEAESAQEVVRLEEQIGSLHTVCTQKQSELDANKTQMETESLKSQDTIAQLRATIASLEAEIDDARTQTRAQSDQVRQSAQELQELQGDRRALEDAADARDARDRERESARHARESAALGEVELLRLDVCSLRQELLQCQQRAMEGMRSTVLRVHATAAAHVDEVEAELGRRVADISRLDQTVTKLHEEMAGMCRVVAGAVLELENICRCMNEDASHTELVHSRAQVAEAGQADYCRQLELLSSQMVDMEANFHAVLESSKHEHERELRELQQVCSAYKYFSASAHVCVISHECVWA